MRLHLFAVAGVLCALARADDVRYIPSKLAAGDLTSAEAIADEFCRANAGTSECAYATSWLARGAELLKEEAKAKLYVERSSALNKELLKKSKVEDDEYLALAVGANYEVRAHLLVDEGARDQAITLLQAAIPEWRDYGVQARLRKNLNLLTLVGSPAPVAYPEMAGKPTLLFLWGHWCSDCTGEEPVMARLWKRYRSQGLVMIAPNRRHGSVGEKDNVPAAEEDAEIERVWKSSYADLGDVPHPVDEKAMRAYGVTSTPTLVLVDRKGIVRMYQPYRLSEDVLARQIDEILR